MNITAIKVDGFGVWSDLTLDELGEELNVFCGPNEAGKTTLLQFVRAVLYGFSPERKRYLPPLSGGRPGGQLELASQQGSFLVSRHADRTNDNGRTRAVITASDGSRQPEPLLRQILCDVDEKVFKNVFACGLQEIQQLGSLSDSEAAELLFSLSTGLDRVCLVDVMRELDVSRRRLLGDDGQSGQIVQLLGQRDRIEREIDELASLTAAYGRLATQRNNLDRESGRLQEEKERLSHEARCIEIALAVCPRWHARAELEARLSDMQTCGHVPDDALATLQRLDNALKKHKTKISRLNRHRRMLRKQSAAIELNAELCRRSVQIEALAEQASWLSELEKRCAELELENEKIKEDLEAEYANMGLDGGSEVGNDSGQVLPELDRRTLRGLRGEIRSLRRCRETLNDARRDLTSAERTARDAQQKIAAELSSRGADKLSEAIDASGELVARFRRRAQLDDRYQQMEQYQAELEARTRQLVAREVMPAWTLVGLGGVIVVGAILLLGGIFMSSAVTGGFGWIISTIGLLGLIAGVAAKFFIERANANQMQSVHKQLHMLRLQLQEADEQRQQLDAALPGRGTPLDGRLEAAQSELASLEQLMPLDAERQAALREAESASVRAAGAEEELAQAKRRWRQALQAAGLSEKFSPQQVRLIVRRRDRLQDLSLHLQRTREELRQRNEQLQGLSGRIYQMAVDTGVPADAEPPGQLLLRLADQLKQQQTRVTQRRALRDRIGRLRRLRTKHQRAVRRLSRRRGELFERCGTSDEDEFRRMASLQENAESLRRELDALGGEIAGVVGKHCPEDEIASLLDNFSGEELQARMQRSQGRLEEIEGSMRTHFEKRGRLAEKMSILAEDRRPAEKQLEYALIKQRLKEAVRRWRVLALSSRVLQDVRLVYERDRQPAALQEASGYLDRLTQGRYTRVWTPLGEDVLRVDDAAGNSLPCELLSRGTREQLFLSLRLSLVSSYAQRGAKLPLVLDDVLVNFDTARAKAAATVLADFARQGHQLLVFTCHDHILKLFRSLRVRVSRLPHNSSRRDVDDEADSDSHPQPEANDDVGGDADVARQGDDEDSEYEEYEEEADNDGHLHDAA